MYVHISIYPDWRVSNTRTVVVWVDSLIWVCLSLLLLVVVVVGGLCEVSAYGRTRSLARSLSHDVCEHVKCVQYAYIPLCIN